MVESRAPKWTYLGILFAITALSYADRGILSILLEPIRREFHLSDRALGLLGGAPFAVAYAAVSVPFALAADRRNRKWTLMSALGLWSAMTALCGAVVNLPMLIMTRIGVGVGEGGGLPATHALIAEYFPTAQRSRAFAILTASATVGGVISIVGGGLISGRYGWRACFIAVASLSIPVALVAAAVLKEPGRRAVQGQSSSHEPAGKAIFDLLRKRSYVAMICGFTLYAVFAYGPLVFVPAYLARCLGLTPGQISATYGLAAPAATLGGTILGGFLADRLTVANPAWMLRLPAIGLVAAAPLAVATFLARGAVVFSFFYFLLALTIFATLPPIFSAIQFVSGSRRRAIATAIAMAALNIIGMTTGPILTGLLSDAFKAQFGVQSLRYAILAMVVFLIPAGASLWWSSRTMSMDAETD